MTTKMEPTKKYTCPTCDNVTRFPDHVEDHEMVCSSCPRQDGELLHTNLADIATPFDSPGAPRPAVPYLDSPNRSSGLSVSGIVIHYTTGSYASAISLFQDPSKQVSAHFVVAKDGRRTQMVPLPDPDHEGPRDGRYQAWHCFGGNTRYIGIEHEGNGGPGEWTDAMLQSSAEISAYLCSLYNIPIAGPPGPPGQKVWFTGIGGHYNVPGNDHTDPGPNFPWESYLELVRGEDMASVPQWQWDRLFDRVLRMSAGVEGQNFNGDQFNYEQGKIDGIIQRLDQIEAQLKKP